MYRVNYIDWLKNVTPKEKKELKEIQKDEEKIKERFSLPLSFGTAGMRGIMGLGTSYINRYTVRKATKGVARYILDQGQQERGVLIAFDTRNNSFKFALETAKVFAAEGIKVYLYNSVRPVPFVSFGVRELNTFMGVMITASHNPKEYNGYKVYGEDGAQLSGAVADQVSKCILGVDSYFNIKPAKINVRASEVKRQKEGTKIAENITIVADGLDAKYYSAIETQLLSTEILKEKVEVKPKIIYTPLHGAGYKPVMKMLKNVPVNVKVVREQTQEDGNFSTISCCPNPEDPEALLLAVELAKKENADLVIGTDPDCDRMGVAVKEKNGSFRFLTGNQTGVLLFNYILTRKQEKGILEKNAAGIKTIVTTNLFDKVAKAFDVVSVNTLTGFKYIGEKIKEWEKTNEHTFLFGYEESYGYLAGTHARDKDAVVSSMLFAEMFCYYKAKGIELTDILNELFEEHGYFAEETKAFVFKGLKGMEIMNQIMQNVRQNLLWDVLDKKVQYVADLEKSLIVNRKNEGKIISLPKSNVLKFLLDEDEWVCIRPSGTEPKIKIYSSCVAENEQKARERAKEMIDYVADSIKINEIDI